MIGRIILAILAILLYFYTGGGHPSMLVFGVPACYYLTFRVAKRTYISETNL